MRKIVQKNEVSIMKLSARRFCTIYPRTPAVRTQSLLCSTARSASICLLLFNFLLLLQNLLTSLIVKLKFWKLKQVYTHSTALDPLTEITRFSTSAIFNDFCSWQFCIWINHIYWETIQRRLILLNWNYKCKYLYGFAL